MANPQTEDGFTKIANEIMEALAKTRIPGEARQVFDFILRKTYGWNRKEVDISLAEFVEGTGLSKVHVCRAIEGVLLKRNLITKKGNAQSLFTKKGNDVLKTYGIQKDFEEWRSLPKKVTVPKKVIHVTQKGNQTLPKKVSIIKENIKERYATFFKTFWKTYPARNGRKVGKKVAEEYFHKIPENEIKSLLVATVNYANEVKPGYAKDPERFLKKDFWKDWLKKESSNDDLDPMEIEYRRKYGKPLA
jgi:phage replication O-like protein O